MKEKICVDCQKPFTLTDAELRYYQEKGLSEPKRCKACREKNKARKEGAAAPFEPQSATVIWMLFGSSCFLFSLLLDRSSLRILFLALSLLFYALFFFNLRSNRKDKAAPHEIPDLSHLPQVYGFHSDERLREHFKKHGAETHCTGQKEYAAKANLVIYNKAALQKTEPEDGDRVYYLEETGEIVFLSKYGFIRTYYIANKDYFNRI